LYILPKWEELADSSLELGDKWLGIESWRGVSAGAK
jgi:hypothetical protein